MKYHVRDNGELGECRADVQDCPLKNVTHFDNLQEAENHATMVLEKEFPVVETLKKEFPMKIVSAKFGPMAGGRYFGCHMNKDDVKPFLEQLRKIVGTEKAAAMEADKAARDCGYVYHTTVIRPQESKSMKGVDRFPEFFNIEMIGLGHVDDGKNEAWFVVCDSPEANTWRAEHGLPPHNLHVTLAFSGKDVHSMPKGRESLVQH